MKIKVSSKMISEKDNQRKERHSHPAPDGTW
jgi:hypothetical protein